MGLEGGRRLRKGSFRRSTWIGEILKRGRRVGDQYFTVCYRIGAGRGRRLGLIFGKRAGRAVVRNRAKRIIREFFRLSSDRLPTGLEMVVMAQEKLSGLSSKEIRVFYEALLRRARLLKDDEPPSCSS